MDHARTTEMYLTVLQVRNSKNCYLLAFQNITGILLICLLLNYHNPVCFIAIMVTCDHSSFILSRVSNTIHPQPLTVLRLFLHVSIFELVLLNCKEKKFKSLLACQMFTSLVSCRIESDTKKKKTIKVHGLLLEMKGGNFAGQN